MMATKSRRTIGSPKVPGEDFGGPLDWRFWDRWAFTGDILDRERPADLNYQAVEAAVESEVNRLIQLRANIKARGPSRANELLGKTEADEHEGLWIRAWESVLSAHASMLSGIDRQARERQYWSEQSPIDHEQLTSLCHGLPAAVQARIRRLSFDVNRTLNEAAAGAPFRHDLKAALAAFREHVQESRRRTLSVHLLDGTVADQSVYVDGNQALPRHLGGQAPAFVSPQAHAALEAFELELHFVSRFDPVDHVAEDVKSAVQSSWPKKPRPSKLRPELERCFDAVMAAYGEDVLRRKNLTWTASRVSAEFARRAGVEKGPVYNTVLPVLLVKMPWHEDAASRRKTSK